MCTHFIHISERKQYAATILNRSTPIIRKCMCLGPEYLFKKERVLLSMVRTSLRLCCADNASQDSSWKIRWRIENRAVTASEPRESREGAARELNIERVSRSLSPINILKEKMCYVVFEATLKL